MNHRTDTELRRAWEALQARRAGAAGSTLAEIERDESLIRAEWREIVARKRRGENTDPDAVNRVERAIRQRAQLAGIPVRVSTGSMGVTAELQPLPWVVMGMYDGPLDKYDEGKMRRLSVAIYDELKDEGVPIASERPSDDECALCTEIATRRRGVHFIVPVWTWNGPDGRRE